MAAGSGIGGFGAGSSGGASMQPKLKIKLDGVSQLRARMKILAAGLIFQGTVSLPRAIAEDIAEVAEDLAPFDADNDFEPHVRDSIHVRSVPKGAEVYVNRTGMRDEVPVYLEFGTYKMAARPFLKPAGRLVMEAGGMKRASRGIGGLLSPKGKSFGG